MSESKLNRALNNFNKKDAIVFDAKVISIDESNYSCIVEPIYNNTQLPNVQMKAVLDGAKESCFIKVPAVNSFVTCIKVADSEQNVEIINTTKLSKLLLFGDGKDGLVMVNELVTQINRIENKLNDFINLVVAHSHTAHNTPSATLTGYQGISPITAKADIENTKILQGSV